MSYSETDVFLACFSVTSKTSLHNVREKWVPEIRQNSENSKTPIVLVGLKKDLRTDPKTIRMVKESGELMVEEKDGKDMAILMNCATYCECSAKTREGLDDVFVNAIAAVLDPERFTIGGKTEKAFKKKRRLCCIL